MDSDEKITLTNHDLFYRKNGLPCPHCGSLEEYLWVVGNAVFLMCSKCDKHKGKDPYLESTGL
jgi:translation initiation factor 2 beta subunit (eIF-2beta)/eIF-5